MIRVLRLMEYVYETPEQAEEDMARWMVPPIGAYSFGCARRKVRSTILTNLQWRPEDDDS